MQWYVMKDSQQACGTERQGPAKYRDARPKRVDSIKILVPSAATPPARISCNEEPTTAAALMTQKLTVLIVMVDVPILTSIQWPHMLRTGIKTPLILAMV